MIVEHLTRINGRSESSLLLGSLKIIRIASSLNNISYDDSGAFYSCYFIYYFCINITLHCTHKGDMFSPQSNEVSAKQKTDRMKDPRVQEHLDVSKVRSNQRSRLNCCWVRIYCTFNVAMESRVIEGCVTWLNYRMNSCSMCFVPTQSKYIRPSNGKNHLNRSISGMTQNHNIMSTHISRSPLFVVFSVELLVANLCVYSFLTDCITPLFNSPTHS